jgi:hypothetical protein
MFDNLRAETQRSDRINVNERWEIQYWTERMGVTDAQLREAVRMVGPTAGEVRKYLRRML